MSMSTLKFHLPGDLNAKKPPERRGIRRDYVRMMVIDKKTGVTEHSTFNQLVDYLNKGDLLVLNTSRTVPAVLQGVWECTNFNKKIEVRLAHRKSENIWEALIVGEDVNIGDKISFTELLTATVTSKEPNSPFVKLAFSLCCSDLYDQIYRIGQPVRYEYIDEPWGLDYYQTVFATSPGSVEMPSAGRAFSWELIFQLQRKGINIAYIQLHTGLSYLMDDKWHVGPRENYEEYHIPEETIAAIREAKSTGNRIIAVGTTVVRTLESALDSQYNTESLDGWTNLYISHETNLKIVDGLITGLHEPEASHLDLLTAFIDKNTLFKAYQEAIDLKYLWHEFGDINIILPNIRPI